MEQAKKRSGRPRVHGPRTELHIKMPDHLLASIMEHTDNLNAWMVQASEEKLERERENHEVERSNAKRVCEDTPDH